MIYLDNAATTRPYKEVVSRVADVSYACFANASSPHAFGKKARSIIEETRCIVAKTLDVLPEEIFFTSGGTEANNLATRGSFMAAAAVSADVDNNDPDQAIKGDVVQPNLSIITSEQEHPSVTRSLRDLKRSGYPVTYIAAPHGVFDLESYKKALDANVALISLMWTQNVFGYHFPIEQAARLRDELAPKALLHSDAVQAYGFCELRPKEIGIDLLSISAHKIGGPKGVGALYVRNGIKMFTTVFGGGQEDGLRSGTEAVPLIAGFAKAVEIMQGDGSKIAATTTRLRSVWLHLESRLRQQFPEVVLNSRADGSPAILHFSIPGLNNKNAIDFLGDRNIYIGISTACDTNHIRPNEVVRKKHPLVARLAGLSAEEEQGSFRASFGVDTTIEDVDALVDTLVYFRERLG